MSKRIVVLVLCLLALAGCATSSSYVNYTYQRFPAKDPTATVNVYPESQAVSTANPYYVIGKVSVEGFASNGVTRGSLSYRAQDIARRKGADAIINAKNVAYRYYDGDVLLRFTGELIVYSSALTK